MSISLEEVRHVAKLARLELDESEMLSLQGELNALLGHFEDIQGLEVEFPDVWPRVLPLYNVMAPDTVGPTLPRERAMSNGARTKAGLFVVPAIIES